MNCYMDSIQKMHSFYTKMNTFIHFYILLTYNLVGQSRGQTSRSNLVGSRQSFKIQSSRCHAEFQ